MERWKLELMGDLNTHPIPHLTYKETEAESDYRN